MNSNQRVIHAPSRPRLVRRVTREHGEAFTEALRKTLLDSGAAGDAIDAAHVMEFPSDPEQMPVGTASPAQLRYFALQEEIVNRIGDVLQSDLSTAFVRVANQVFAEERARRRRR